MRHHGAGQKGIARALNRSPSTISRELWRNRTEGEYSAAQPQRQAQQQRRSITFDNGMEFARCRRRAKYLAVALYSAELGCLHQRGTHENARGPIRQYFPKRIDFRTITHHVACNLEDLLDNRPRSGLGYQTPNEVFLRLFPPKRCV